MSTVVAPPLFPAPEVTLESLILVRLPVQSLRKPFGGHANPLVRESSTVPSTGHSMSHISTAPVLTDKLEVNKVLKVRARFVQRGLPTRDRKECEGDFK